MSLSLGAIDKSGALLGPDALIDQALQHCHAIRQVMVGLRKAAVNSKSNVGSATATMGKASPWKGGPVGGLSPCAAASTHQTTLLPTSDAVQIACRAVDEIADALEVLLHERLRRVFTTQTKSIDALRGAVMVQLSEEAAASSAAAPSAEALSAATAEDAMMRTIHDAQAGDDLLPRFELPDTINRRQSWIAQACSPSDRRKNHARSVGAGAAGASFSFGSFHPSASAIVVKQMDRWKQNHQHLEATLSIPPTDLAAASVPPHRLALDQKPCNEPSAAENSSRRPPSGGSSSPKRNTGGASTPSSVPAPYRPPSALSRRSSTRRPTTSGGASVDGVRPAHLPPFPYAHTTYPNDPSVASWWHRVVHELQCGSGTTVLTLTGSAISQETAEVMLSEVSTEPPCLAQLVGAVLSLRPDDSMLYLIHCQPNGSTSASWREHAASRQSRRLAVGSPILAARNSREARMLLSERLQFATDRPDEGLLEVLHRDAAKLEQQGNLWIKGDMRTVASPSAKCGRGGDGPPVPLDLVPRPRGAPSPYFCTSGSDTEQRLAPRGHMSAVDASSGAGSPRSEPDPAGGPEDDPVEDFAVIDVYPHIVAPTSYALCSVHPFHAGDAPRSWVLEGSADHGATWVTLREHVSDETIGGVSDFAVFDIPPIRTGLPAHDNLWGDASVASVGGIGGAGASTSITTLATAIPSRSGSPRHASEVTSRFCGSMFRIRNTGPNAQGNHGLQVSAMELYGRCLSRGHPREQVTDHDGGDDTLASVFGCVLPTEAPCVARMRKMQWAPFAPLPPPPAGAKAKGKGKK